MMLATSRSRDSENVYWPAIPIAIALEQAFELPEKRRTSSAAGQPQPSAAKRESAIPLQRRCNLDYFPSGRSVHRSRDKDQRGTDDSPDTPAISFVSRKGVIHEIHRRAH